MCIVHVSGSSSALPHLLHSAFLLVLSHLRRNIFDVFLKPYFLEAYRPVHKGKCNGKVCFVYPRSGGNSVRNAVIC